MSNHDDFWTTLAAGHTNTVLAGAMDSHLSGKSIGESFGSVRTLTDAHRQANALPLPVEAGTKVVFAGGLGSYLSYDDVPADGVVGEVVKVKSATGEITHHDGRVFVKWGDGQLRTIHAEHLRLAGQATKTAAALPQPGDIFEATSHYMDIAGMGQYDSAMRMNFLVHPDGSASVMKGDKPMTHKGGQLTAREVETLFRRGATRGLGVNTSLEEPKIVRRGKKASVIRVASLGDLTQFLKRADGKLVHKSTNDLWSYSKDADGNFLVERLFDDEGSPLKG